MAGDTSDGFDCRWVDTIDSADAGGGRCDHADGRWFTWIDGN